MTTSSAVTLAVIAGILVVTVSCSNSGTITYDTDGVYGDSSYPRPEPTWEPPLPGMYG